MSDMAELRVRQVPEAVYRGLKVWAAEELQSLNDTIIEILKAAVEARKGKR